jgi:hypothetical protein
MRLGAGFEARLKAIHQFLEVFRSVGSVLIKKAAKSISQPVHRLDFAGLAGRINQSQPLWLRGAGAIRYSARAALARPHLTQAVSLTHPSDRNLNSKGAAAKVAAGVYRSSWDRDRLRYRSAPRGGGCGR